MGCCFAYITNWLSKTEFIYSEEFYKLDEFEKKKYQNDKMTTEAHLGTLCNLLWGEKFQFGNNGLFDLFGLGIIGSMFNGGGFGTMPPMPKLEGKELENAQTEIKPE